MNKSLTLNLNDTPAYSKTLIILLYSTILVIAIALGVYGYVNTNSFSQSHTIQSHAVQSHAVQSDSLQTAADQRIKTIVGGVPQTTIQYVAQRLRVRFMAGDWRYGGIGQSGGIVQVYIQIPNKLDFNPSQQAGYIRDSLCPVATDGIWSKLSPRQLEIHLFTETKSNSVFAACG